MSAPIRFYFDFTSTFSYIAAHKIDDVAAKHGRAVDWRAISLGHLFHAQSIVPPPTIPTKLKYLSQDFQRSCEFAGLPCAMPKVFPPDVKLARLTFWALKAKDDASARVFARNVSMAIFGRGQEAATAQQLEQISGVPVADIEAAAADSTAKRAVITALDDAVKDGMVGAPFFVLDGEMFWGADRLDHLERRLQRKG
jgi:2-hydroxychromene-2-carboxylate isomerase